MKRVDSKVAALIAGTIGALLIAGGAYATSETRVVAPKLTGEETIKYVSYADLNIASDTGMAVLMSRIETAADEVCGSSHYRRAGSFSRARLNAQCQKEAIEEALSQLST